MEMEIEVKRYRFKDPASSYNFPLWGRIRTYFLSKYHGFRLGENCIIKKNVSIRLTNNAILRLGNNVIIEEYSFILLTKPEPVLTIGNHVGIGRNTVIAIKGNTEIGDFTQLAPYCVINDQSHSSSPDDLIMNQKSIIEGVKIGSDCWLGSGVRVLKGVTIGDGSIVGAGAVVNRSIPPYEIWAGVPARFIKKRE